MLGPLAPAQDHSAHPLKQAQELKIVTGHAGHIGRQQQTYMLCGLLEY